MNFVKLLELHSFPDLEILPGGIKAKRRPDIAPLAFEVAIIASAFDCLDENRIPESLEGANQVIFEELFRSCNGLHVGATKFSVFGFITGDQSVGVPWNIEPPNDVTRAQRPKGTLIVGKKQRHRTGWNPGRTLSHDPKRPRDTCNRERQLHESTAEVFFGG